MATRAIYLSDDIEHWLTHDSVLAHQRGNQWNLTCNDHEGNQLSDNLYHLVTDAVVAGKIHVPNGVDVWCEYATPYSIQVYLCLSEAWTGSATTTMVAPITQLSWVDNGSYGVPGAMFALAAVADIAHDLLSDVMSLGEGIVAQTTSSDTILAALANTGTPAVLRHVIANPYASDETRTWAYLRLGE